MGKRAMAGEWRANMDPANPSEEAALRTQLKEGKPPTCPRCNATLRTFPVPPRSDVAYVRNRALLECDSCRFRVALDRK
jgi:hypothetical protein